MNQVREDRVRRMTEFLSGRSGCKLTVAFSALGVMAFFLIRGALTWGNTSGFQLFADQTGFIGTVSSTGSIDTTGPFFQSLGTNGRACVTCHMPGDAWSVTPTHLSARLQTRV